MSFAIDTYQRRRRNKAEWSQPAEDLDAFVRDSADLLAAAGKPYNISVNHGDYGPDRTLAFIRRRLKALLPTTHPGTPVVVAAQHGDEITAYAFRRVHQPIAPAPTGGSPDISLIHAAVVTEFGGRGWGLHSVGLYVRKPGEHGATGAGWHGNAEDWEFSDSPSNSAAAHAKLDELGKWLVAQQSNGLPVGGVISQGQSWSIFHNGWQPYKLGWDDFTRHYTHVHVSGVTHDRLSGWF